MQLEDETTNIDTGKLKIFSPLSGNDTDQPNDYLLPPHNVDYDSQCGNDDINNAVPFNNSVGIQSNFQYDDDDEESPVGVFDYIDTDKRKIKRPRYSKKVESNYCVILSF
jgi:hypothetical protein